MRRDRLFGIMLVWLMFPLIGLAQQDDMYFVPKKEKKEVKTKTQTVVQKTPEQLKDSVERRSSGYSFSYEQPYSAASDERDVDEYNRRYRLVDAAQQSEEQADYSAAIGEDSLDERGWVNGFEGSDEDYACARRILLFCSPTVGIPVSSPLYWDLCYGPSSIYWNVYNDGFYAYAFPSYWNSWYCAPWDAGFWWTFRYSSPYWGFGFGWGYPYYGWGYPYWHYPPHYHHSYAWNMHPTTRVGRPAVGRPVSGRPSAGVSTRGARVNRSYTTSGRGARTTTRSTTVVPNRSTTTTRTPNRANRSYQQSTEGVRVSPSGSRVNRSSGSSVIRQSTGGVSRGARVGGGGVSRGRR